MNFTPKKNGSWWGILLAVLMGVSCSEKKKEIVIKGHLANLPDGKMALYTRNRQTGKIIPIDTVETRKGSFSFSIDRAIHPEPIQAYINHVQDKTNTIRIFQFPTNLKYRGGSLSAEEFMLEDSIQINGSLKKDDYTNTGFRLKPNVIANHIDRPIITGRQTRVFYNDTAEFTSLTDVEQIRNLVRQHPYSYYYLYGVERRIATLSNGAFTAVFRSFDPDVQASATGQKLLAYVNQRPTQRLTFATTLVDEQGLLKPILDKKARYNLVVLWASWCGPCREEISSLKKLHARLGNTQKLRLVSVSLDEKRGAWVQAMKKEQMPWQQLLITPPVQTYAKEIFQFDGSIPTMLLVDQRGEIVKTVVGYDEENLAAIEAYVAK